MTRLGARLTTFPIVFFSAILIPAHALATAVLPQPSPTFTDGGAAEGYFTVSNQQITSWDFFVFPGANDASTFSTFEYFNTTVLGSDSTVSVCGPNCGGANMLTVVSFSSSGDLGCNNCRGGGVLSLAMDANPFAFESSSIGTTVQLITGTGCVGVFENCVGSGEGLNPFDFAPQRFLTTPSYLYLSDPPGDLAFDLSGSATPTFTPEPSTLFLLGSGLAGLGTWRRKMLKTPLRSRY